MKNFSKARLVQIFGIIAISAVMVFGVAACDGDDDGGGGGGGNSTLTGTITISPTTATTGTELTATYSGSETVTYQCKKDSSNVGTASATKPNKYTPTAAGSYTVTVSATGYDSKTSAAVTVTAPGSGGGSGGTLTVTDIPATYNGKYAVFIADDVELTGAASVNADDYSGTAVVIANGSVSLPMWTMTDSGIVRYSGNDTVYAMLMIFDQAAVGENTDPVGGYEFESFTFTNGSATISCDDGEEF